MTRYELGDSSFDKDWLDGKAFCPYERVVHSLAKGKQGLCCKMFGVDCPAGEEQMRECNAWLEQGEQLSLE